MWRNKKKFHAVATSGNNGYTILEVMIFLAVSVVLAVSALTLVGGQQAKTEFAQAVRDLDLRLQDLINDVSTGYYAKTKDFGCRVNPGNGEPQLLPVTTDLGTNQDCIVLGQVVEFGLNNSRDIKIYTLVGVRQTGTPAREVQTLDEAMPNALAKLSPSDPNFFDTAQQEALQYGLQVKSVIYNPGTGPIPISAIGFLTTFGALDGGGDLQSGSRSADLYPIPNTVLGDTNPNNVAIKIKDELTDSYKNPSDGVVICMESTARLNQYATITIGSNGRQLSTKLEILNGSCT